MITKFYPSQSDTLPVEVCNHRHGATATFSHQTDTRVLSSIYLGEMLGFKHNVRLGAFASLLVTSGSNTNSGIADAEATGLMRHDVYFATDQWRNPTTGVIGIIPDYTATAWTSAGVSAFPETAVLGAAKPIRTPNHGQQMYDATDGRLGYDLITGTMGESDLFELYAIVNAEQNYFLSQLKRLVSAASYRNGRDESAIPMLPFWLGNRNSNPSPIPSSGTANTFYGYDLDGNPLGEGADMNIRQFFASYPSSYRWWDSWHSGGNSKVAATSYYTSNLAATILNGGWYRDFAHWHTVQSSGEMNEMDAFLQTFRDTVDTDFVWTCSNGEALEYMMLRTMCSRVIAKENEQGVYVLCDVSDPFKGGNIDGISTTLPIDSINIPLSVKVDLTDTTLSGKSIKASYGKLISLGSDVYIVQVPYSKFDGFKTVQLSEGEANYYNTAIPTATVGIVGTTMTVTADMPVRAVLFSVATGGSEYDSVLDGRSNDLALEHTFDVLGGRDYLVGIISEFGLTYLETV